MKDLAGRHALVCGASSGIGRATALALAERGATLTILARRNEQLQALRPILMNAGARETHALVADLDDREGLHRTVEDHLAKVGVLHILINNTGGPPGGPLIEAKEEDFLKAYGRHLLASHLLAQLLVPGMTQAGYGRIVNVLSWSVREPIPGLGVSNTIRATMAAWAKTLSKELPPGITVNSVLPGSVETERLGIVAETLGKQSGKGKAGVLGDWIASSPEKRLGRPEELGKAIAFLCSPDASFIRGVVLPVDGGKLASI